MHLTPAEKKSLVVVAILLVLGFAARLIDRRQVRLGPIPAGEGPRSQSQQGFPGAPGGTADPGPESPGPGVRRQAVPPQRLGEYPALAASSPSDSHAAGTASRGRMAEGKGTAPTGPASVGDGPGNLSDASRPGDAASGRAARLSRREAGGKDSPAFRPVDINRASAEDLTRLNGVGPSTARAIILDRRENGPYRRVEDLLRVKGIGQKKLEKIRPYVIISAGPSDSTRTAP